MTAITPIGGIKVLDTEIRMTRHRVDSINAEIEAYVAPRYQQLADLDAYLGDLLYSVDILRKVAKADEDELAVDDG